MTAAVSSLGASHSSHQNPDGQTKRILEAMNIILNTNTTFAVCSLPNTWKLEIRNVSEIDTLDGKLKSPSPLDKTPFVMIRLPNGACHFFPLHLVRKVSNQAIENSTNLGLSCELLGGQIGSLFPKPQGQKRKEPEAGDQKE